MKPLSHLLIPHSHIALFGSGNSIHDISKEDFETIKANAFVITLNYAPIQLKGHLNIWSDRKVSDFLEKHYKTHPKDCLLVAQEGRVPPSFKSKIDYWFNRKEDNLQGNYTIVWTLQLLQKYFPEKRILLFGVDLYAENKEQAKWYDRYTDFDKNKRGRTYKIAAKLNQCGFQIHQFVARKNVFNCNPKSKLQHFEKRDWRALMQLSEDLVLQNEATIRKNGANIYNNVSRLKTKTSIESPNGNKFINNSLLSKNHNNVKRGNNSHPKVYNVFICLVHEQEDCVLDMLKNLKYLDPLSKIILYNGSSNPNLLSNKTFYQQNEILIHPSPKPQKHGYLHGFALDCMKLAVEYFDFETITNVDSDQLALRKGYTEFISNYLKEKPNVGMLSSDPKRFTVQNSPKRMVIRKAFQEFNLWKPFLNTFPNGEQKYAHWTFWPSTVITKSAVTDLLKLFRENDMLKGIMAKTKIWATEEVIFPTLIKLMGYDIHLNPCSFDFVKYKVKFNTRDISVALRKKNSFWMHPINRKYQHELRRTIREKFNRYSSKEKCQIKIRESEKEAPDAFFDLGKILERIRMIEGWLNDKEAMLLASTTLQACFNSGRSNSIVEIGCYHGKFTIILGSIVKAFFPKMKIYSIDPHDGRLGEKNKVKVVAPSYESFKENLKKNNLEDNVVCIQDVSINVKWKKTIALLVIDGLHDYESVKTDFEQFAHYVIPNGYVVFHDYSKYFPGVIRFINELLVTGSYRKVNLVNSLLVLQVKK